MYDLDKTQEWLNRTMQLNNAPPVRGGIPPEPHARKHTTLAVSGAFLVIALGILLISRTGIKVSQPSAGVVRVDGSTRVQAAVERDEIAPLRSTAPAISGSSIAQRQAPARPSWPPLSLDGDVVPLPGRTAPPAPVWMDGAPR